MESIYVLSVIAQDGSVLRDGLFCIGIDNTKKAAKEMKAIFLGCNIFCNKAETCFDGYLVRGKYIGII